MSHSASGKRTLSFEEIIDILGATPAKTKCVSDIYALVMAYLIDTGRQSITTINHDSDNYGNERIGRPSIGREMP